ncbi:MAG: PIN domain-containing protein [Elainella sp.]
MTISYRVRAEVIDISADSPKPTDRFLVDTNVWYWLTYPPASSSAHPYQIKHYPKYIESAVVATSELYCSGLTFAELAHLIEKAEQAIFSRTIKSKEYRHNYPAQRAKVVSEVQAAWSAICPSYASQIGCSIDGPTVDAAIKRFQTQALDGYDLFILQSMQQHALTQIITDDGDYVTVPDIRVFTANRTAIKAAQTQGKLIAR